MLQKCGEKRVLVRFWWQCVLIGLIIMEEQHWDPQKCIKPVNMEWTKIVSLRKLVKRGEGRMEIVGE